MADNQVGGRCCLLLGEAPGPEAAAKIADVFSACPYVYFMAAFGPLVVGVYFLEGPYRGWLEAVAEDPQGTLGLSRAALYVTDRPAFPPTLELSVPQVRGERAPCGARCRECPQFGEPCPGCPAADPGG
ncbi:MAG: hypothetical protein ACP5G2_05930 [Candidatus Bipolaricaulaceae bacterium]